MLGKKERKEILCKHRRNPRKDDKESRKILEKAFLEPILTSDEKKEKFNLLNLGGKSLTMAEEEKTVHCCHFPLPTNKEKQEWMEVPQDKLGARASTHASFPLDCDEEKCGTSDNILKSHENVFSPTKGAQMT